MMSLLAVPAERTASIARAALQATVRTVLSVVPPTTGTALDAELQRVATVFGLSGQDRLPVSLLRVAYRVDAELWQGPVPDGVVTQDEQLELPADPSGPARTVRVRTYTPSHHDGGGMVYLHGGGYTIGSIASHDATCRRLAAGAGVIIQSVEYRLAPEHPFPAGLTDMVTSWTQLQRRWVAGGGDPARFGVGGDSAGGHGATMIADEAVAATLGVDAPMPGFCWLVYPGTETVHHHALGETLSSGGLMSGRMVVRFSEFHGGEPAAPALNPGLRPVEVLAQHPPTWIQTVGLDPLMAEGQRYAAALADAGVSVTHEHEPTMGHAYISMTGVSAGAAAAFGRATAALRTLSAG